MIFRGESKSKLNIKILKSHRWNEDLLAGFDLSQKSKKEETKEKTKETKEKIPDIKEPDVKITKDNACAIM